MKKMNEVLKIQNSKGTIKKQVKAVINNLEEYEVVVFSDSEVRTVCGSEQEQEITIVVQVISEGVNEKFVWRRVLLEHKRHSIIAPQWVEFIEQATNELYEWTKGFINESKVVKGESKVIERY